MSEYNGWTNYETWCVNLWVENEQGTHEHARELTRDMIEGGNDGNPAPDLISEDNHIRHRLADIYKDWIEEMVHEQTQQGCLAADLVQAALSEVNWDEIAEALIDAHKDDRLDR